MNDESCYNCGRRNPALWGFAPVLRRLGQDLGFAQFVIVGSIGLYLATLAASADPFGGRGLLTLFSPDSNALRLFGASGAYPVFVEGKWWTVLSAGWLHGGLLHILFNMLWVRDLARPTSQLYGPGRMMIIYTVAGACGFLLSSATGYYFYGIPLLAGSLLTVGASAPIFGLLGSLVYYGRRTGSSLVGGEALRYAAILFAFGLFMPGIDNYAHAGGFGGGWLIARWLDPMTRERGDHLILGVICILATWMAVGASLLTGLGII